VLVHPAAEGLDDLVHRIEEAAHQAVQLLGVDLAAERGEAHQIGEEDRHLAPFALGANWGCLGGVRGRICGGPRRWAERRAAAAAEAVGRRVFEVALGTLHGKAL
jgi:hypothetical protein